MRVTPKRDRGSNRALLVSQPPSPPLGWHLQFALPPSWTSRESYLVPPVVFTGTGTSSVVTNCKSSGQTARSSTLPTPSITTPPRRSAFGLVSLPRRVASAPRGFPPRRVSGFGCCSTLPGVSGSLCRRAICRERHGAVNWVDRLRLGPPQGSHRHITRESTPWSPKGLGWPRRLWTSHGRGTL